MADFRSGAYPEGYRPDPYAGVNPWLAPGLQMTPQALQQYGRPYPDRQPLGMLGGMGGSSYGQTPPAVMGPMPPFMNVRQALAPAAGVPQSNMGGLPAGIAPPTYDLSGIRGMRDGSYQPQPQFQPRPRGQMGWGGQNAYPGLGNIRAMRAGTYQPQSQFQPRPRQQAPAQGYGGFLDRAREMRNQSQGQTRGGARGLLGRGARGSFGGGLY